MRSPTSRDSDDFPSESHSIHTSSIQASSRRPVPSVCFLVDLGPGHHASYLELFQTALSERGIASFATNRPFTAAFHAGPVFILMSEQYPISSYALAIARSAARRRTVALLFRSKEVATGNSIRHRAKRLLLKIVRRQKCAAFLSIVPHQLVQGLETLLAGWIDDPQLWDVPVLDLSRGATPLSRDLSSAAAGRKIVVCLGLLVPGKGLTLLERLAADASFTQRFLLVLAGHAPRDQDVAAIRSNPNCSVINRYLADDELLSLYGIADFMWAAYAPDYDQASGVFGRAVQFGVMPIVRQGSLIQSYARYLDVAAAVLDWTDETSVIVRLLDNMAGHAVVPLDGANRDRMERNLSVTIGALLGAGGSAPPFSPSSKVS